VPPVATAKLPSAAEPSEDCAGHAKSGNRRDTRGDGPRYRFAGYELDIDAWELRRGGQPVKLEPKPLAVLTELVRNQTRIVTHEELRAKIWQNTHVSDGSLPRAVAALRAALGRESGRTDGIVKTVRGRGYRIGVPVTQALPDLASRAPIDERESVPLLGMERGRGSTDPQRARRARVCGELALLSLRANEPDRADLVLEEMLAHTRRVEDPVLALELCTEHLQIAGLGLPPVDPSRHLTRIDHVIAEAERLGNARAELEARKQRMDQLLQAGERAALEAECERFARASVRSGGLMHLRAAAYPVMLATLSGDWEQARRGIAEYEDLADPNDRPETPFTPVTQRVLIAQNDTELAAAERDVRQVIADFPEWPTWRCALTYVLMRRERRRETRAELESVVREGLDPGPPQLNHPVFLAVVAEAASWLGATQHAAESYERLRPFAGRNLSHGWAVGCHGPVDHFLALLARLLGRRAEARRLHEGALAMAERLGSPPWKARVQLALADTLAEQPRSAERARVHAREARDLATALGMRRLAEGAERLLRTKERSRSERTRSGS